MKKNINKYNIKHKYGDKLISLINYYHYTGTIDMVKTNDYVSFTVISNIVDDFYDIIPYSTLNKKVLNKLDKNKSLVLIDKIKQLIISKLKIDSIKELNLNFLQILNYISNFSIITKLLFIKNICIYIGVIYNNKKNIIRITESNIELYTPTFSIFNGFSGDYDEIDKLNIYHKEWLINKNNVTDKIFNSDII